MREDRRQTQWAANWGSEEEEVNTAAAKGYGGKRDSKGGKEKGLQLGRGKDMRSAQWVQKEGRGQRAKGVQRLWLGGTPPSSHAGGLPGARVGGQRPGSRVMARPAEQVGGRHRPPHPAPRRRPPGRGSVPFHRRPGHGGGSPSTAEVRTSRWGEQPR